MTNTKMIILCGGRGKRMGSFTTNIPKPMIKIGGKPIIEHKIKYYQSRGIDKFIFCLGYKANILKKFLIKKTNKSIFNNGGIKTLILKIIYLAKHNITSDTLISYGDTLAKINFKDLISKHKKSKCMITIVVAPIQNPFGLVNWNAKGRATKFDEKPILNHFIGYAVLSPNFFKNISKKIINLSDGKGVVQAINYLIKKKEVNIYKFNDLQVTINSPAELKNAKVNYDKYFTLNETPQK
jgi:glucose-1-phosphate cytidylyltransferase